jgi:hypothetical protein
MADSHRYFVFIDLENVPAIDLAPISGKPVHVSLLLGKNQTKLSLPLVEQIKAFSSQVELVKVGASGHNALDMVLSAHLGRATAIHPEAEFAIVSKDKDFDPLIAHLLAHNIRVSRHPDVALLPFVGRPKRSHSSTPRSTASKTPPAPSDSSASNRPTPATGTPRGSATTPPSARAGTPATTRSSPPNPASDRSAAPARGSVNTPLRTAKSATPPVRPPTPAPAPAAGLDSEKSDRWGKLIARLRAEQGPRPRNRARLTRHIATSFGNTLSSAEVEEAIQKLVSRGILTLDADGRVNYPTRSGR